MAGQMRQKTTKNSPHRKDFLSALYIFSQLVFYKLTSVKENISPQALRRKNPFNLKLHLNCENNDDSIE